MARPFAKDPRHYRLTVRLTDRELLALERLSAYRQAPATEIVGLALIAMEHDATLARVIEKVAQERAAVSD